MWPRCDQLREVAEEQRQQQHLDVRAVDVGVRQDADLAVAQAATGRASSSAPCGSTPIATAMSWISLLANRRSRSTSQAFSTLPRSGRIAWRLLVAAHLGAAAGGIALDQEQLVAAPGRGSRSRSACRAARRRPSPCASRPSGSRAGASAPAGSRARRASCRSRRAGSATARAPACTQVETSRSASRQFRRSLIWPWNCGSSTLADSTKLARENTSSGISLTPLGSSACMSMKPLTAPNRPSFRPDSCVPPATVGIRLT